LLKQAEALEAFRAFQAFQAAVVSPRVKYSVWRFIIVDDKRTCEECAEYDDDVYELEDPNDLYGMFPYGEFTDDDTFAPNAHPNCRCMIVKEEEVLFGEEGG
jgi:uncharacterized protein with gpF-like domain